jgi:cell division protein FtsZ
MQIEMHEEQVAGPSPTIIKVIGCGGAGTNAVNWMDESGLSGVQFYAANTDVQSLNASRASFKLPIGSKLTKGLGAGSDPNVGEKAAMEDREMIVNALKGADMVFVTAGMGGGTGTGSAPVVAQIARECGALTVGVVTKPFEFEGKHKMRVAEEGIARMQEAVDSLIIIPNQMLFRLADRSINYKNAFHKVDDVLRNSVQSISDMIVKNGFMNIDFADVKTAMRGQGDALMGMGVGKGDKRACDAANNAMNNPLLEEASIAGARHILVNITAGEDFSIPEYDEIVKLITAEADPDALIKAGIVEDHTVTDEVRVTVVATGFQPKIIKTGLGADAPETVKKTGELFTVAEWDNVLTGAKRSALPSANNMYAGGGYGRGVYAGRGFRDDDIDVPAILRERKFAVPAPQTGDADFGLKRKQA